MYNQLKRKQKSVKVFTAKFDITEVIIPHMIPLKDTIPSRTFPFVNYTIILINLAVLSLSDSPSGLIWKVSVYLGRSAG